MMSNKLNNNNSFMSFQQRNHFVDGGGTMLTLGSDGFHSPIDVGNRNDYVDIDNDRVSFFRYIFSLFSKATSIIIII